MLRMLRRLRRRVGAPIKANLVRFNPGQYQRVGRTWNKEIYQSN